MVLRKSFYIRWSAGRSPRVHEVNPGRDPSTNTYSCAMSGMSIERMKMDGRDSAECQNWEKKDIDVILEMFK